MAKVHHCKPHGHRITYKLRLTTWKTLHTSQPLYLSELISHYLPFREVVREDCQARKLNKEDAMDRCKWRKVIKEAR